MEQMIRQAFASERSAPNKRLADLIARVERKYGVGRTELDDDLLGLVSAAGASEYSVFPKEDKDE